MKYTIQLSFKKLAIMAIIGLLSMNFFAQEKPNVVIIYMDDLGYGDVGAYGATALKTPNMDKLAEAGVMFSDGHASSSTCTPSRYALLTGQYPWRNKNARILSGTAPLLIDTNQMTLPKIFKEEGYHTGIVGKWHLGLGRGNVDWNERVSPGPNEVGFDYSFIMAATQDRTPTVYLENGYVVGLEENDPLHVSYKENFEGEPTGKDNPDLLKMKWAFAHNQSIVNGISRIGYQKGGKTAMWVDENMADDFLSKAKQYVRNHKEEPFFLYYAFQQPHVPRTPHPRFIDSSGMGPRGDVIEEADWCLGEFIKTLDQEGLLENTLIVFTSDNGPVLNDGYQDDANERLGDHKPWGPLRGGKYSLYEAGTRVPFMVYWKGKIEPVKSDALISQLDLMSSLAALVGSKIKGPDSKELLDVFMGNSQNGRNELVYEANSRTAIRKGDWVMIPPYNTPKLKEFQLYNLKTDLGQKKNLAEKKPKKLKKMVKTFEQIRGK